jgi:uncharacterized protein YcbK (DUF882 family)
MRVLLTLFAIILLTGAAGIYAVTHIYDVPALKKGGPYPPPRNNPPVETNEKINLDLIEDNLAQAGPRTRSQPRDAKSSVRQWDTDPWDAISQTEAMFEVIPYKDLALHNVNTNENLEVVFWVGGAFVPSALNELDTFMRDWRKNQVIDIDPELYLLMYELHDNVHADNRIHLISGHRSKKTNDSLRAMGRNTAKKSQHVLGKAADIFIPDVSVKELREEALALEEGGVGYYPQDGFVHVDTGKVRQW